MNDPAPARVHDPMAAGAPAAPAPQGGAEEPHSLALPATQTGADHPDAAQNWRQSSMAVLLGAVVALGCLLAAYLGAVALPLLPWGPAALTLGVALAAVLRWGRQVIVGAAAGTVLAMAGLGLLPWQALWVSAALVLACLMGAAGLARLGFDARFERSRDVAALVLAVALFAALPAAALVAAALADVGAMAAEFFIGWGVLAAGALAAAVPALSVDRRLLHLVQPDAHWAENAAAAAGIVGVGLLLWLAPTGPAVLAPLALLLPHLLVLVLALRGHIAMASAAALGAALLGALSAQTGPSLWAPAAAPTASLVVWMLSLQAVLLITHAAAADARSRRQRWEWALDGSRLGVADWQLPDGPGFASDGFASSAWRKLSGHAARRWNANDWLLQTHPEDRPLLQQALQAVRDGHAGRQQLELRLPQPEVDGGWRWLEATLLVVERTPSGRPTRLLATLSDVQSRRDAQERQLMSVSLFQHLHEGLLVTDADLRALDANPAYSQILGVPRAELLGMVPNLLRPSPADPVARQQRAAMWAGLRDEGHWRGELLERRHDGELRTLHATLSAVRGPQQDLRYHVLVISDVTDQRLQREKLERQAHFDELTRLPNRAHLRQLLDDAMRAADRDGYLLVVCYLDLDRFKPVNDKFGHAAGDRLLSELAGRLRSALRSREQWADAAARLGGDEFVLLLRAGTMEEARLALERVLRVVAQPYVIDPAQDPVQVTTSMGATIYPIDHSDADTLLRHADHAMYGAKQTGRNKYTFFDPEHRRRTEERVMAIGRVQEALDEGEFVLYWQPQVEMTTGRVLGFEALLRWEHPQQGLIAPMQFLPLIENTGLGSRVGDWVLSQSLEYLAQWRRDGLDIKVSVNISARHLQEPDFAQRLAELLARHPEPLAAHLELEMLETAAHADIEATSALLARCRGTGVRFALDDFGTGYSTLKYLQTLPVDTLKIDRSFVNHMLDEAQDRGIVEGVIGLARTFGYAIVAEGVESPAQARTLIEMGCAVGQGTGIAAPMPAEQVAPWARQYRGMFTLATTALPMPHQGTGTSGLPASGPSTIGLPGATGGTAAGPSGTVPADGRQV